MERNSEVEEGILMENVDASPRVKKLMEKLSKDVSFTEMDIHDKTFTKSAIAAEWLGM